MFMSKAVFLPPGTLVEFERILKCAFRNCCLAAFVPPLDCSEVNRKQVIPADCIETVRTSRHEVLYGLHLRPVVERIVLLGFWRSRLIFGVLGAVARMQRIHS